MTEVGLLPVARVALEVATAVLPRYRSRFSKHLFTQPQRLDDNKIDLAPWEAARHLGTVGSRRRARVAMDATGLAQGAVSTFFVLRMYHHTGQLHFGKYLWELQGTSRRFLPGLQATSADATNQSTRRRLPG